MVISVATVLLTALAIYRISNRIAVFDGSQQAAIKSGKRQFGDKPLPIAGSCKKLQDIDRRGGPELKHGSQRRRNVAIASEARLLYPVQDLFSGLLGHAPVGGLRALPWRRIHGTGA